ncbi:MAG: 2-phospho-L-lactate guanylyltransferase [Myxococcota bacterium]|nr:2-phospho-L-lactate guanylyltransferase [Myxococcota bacterium]
MNASLVPVGPLSAGKSRLEGQLPRDTIESLALAMLGDVVEALHATPEVDRVAVVTPDPRVAEASRAADAVVLEDHGGGLNASLDAAGRELLDQGARSLLVVLGDVAGARPADLSALYGALAELGGRGAVLAAARDGGTAALLRSPPDVIPNRFGPDSARAHGDAADALGVGFRRLELPSLRVDLDRAEDLGEILGLAEGAARTRALLAGLDGSPA